MRASAVLGPTPAAALGQASWGQGESVPVSHLPSPLSHRPVSAPETLILGSCHQAEEKTPKPHFPLNSSAFTETPILCEQRGVSSHSPGVVFTLELEEEFALRSSFPVNPERLWSHSPWSFQDRREHLLNLHGWRSRVGKQCVYQMAWNQIPGQVHLSEPRVSALTAPTSHPLPISAQPLVLSVLGSFLRAEPAQILLPFPMPVKVL